MHQPYALYEPLHQNPSGAIQRIDFRHEYLFISLEILAEFDCVPHFMQEIQFTPYGFSEILHY